MFTVTVQLLPAPTVPPLSDTLPDPAVAVTVPPQVFATPGVELTISPDGNVSVNDKPFKGSPVFGFETVIVTVVTPEIGITVVPNDFEMLGGARTVTGATSEWL